MLSDLADKLGVSESAAVAIAVLLVVQVALQLAAIVDLVRRPNAAVKPNKYVWILVILLANLLGPILYFAIGRQSVETVEEPVAETPAASRAQTAADLLYGPDDKR